MWDAILGRPDPRDLDEYPDDNRPTAAELHEDELEYARYMREISSRPMARGAAAGASDAAGPADSPPA